MDIGFWFKKHLGMQGETYHGATKGPKPPEYRHGDQQQEYEQRYGQERSVSLRNREETETQKSFTLQSK